MRIETQAGRWRRARLTNCTDASFPSKVATLTKPSGKGDSAAQATASAVFDLCNTPDNSDAFVQNAIRLKLYGAGSNDNTMSCQVIGWSYLFESGNPATAVWDPTVLVELQGTLTSTITGPSGGVITTTDLFADAITLTYGNDNVSIDRVSPSNNIAAHVLLDFKGFQLLEFTFTTGSSATNCNALWCML